MAIDFSVDKGEYVVLSSGDYSDYGLLGQVKALKSFNILEVFTEWKKTAEVNYGYYIYSSFFSLLLKEGYCVEIDYTEYNLDNMEE